MIGQKDLAIHREIGSETQHPELNNKVWSAAAALGYAAQFPNSPTGRASATTTSLSTPSASPPLT